MRSWSFGTKGRPADQAGSIYFFAVYSAVISYTGLYHWNDLKLGFRSLWDSLFKKDAKRDDFTDVHSRLMKTYREVPEWWYLILNVGLALPEHV